MNRTIDLQESQKITQSDSKKLRVLVVHRYFWPDTPPYATILRRIVGRWKKDGNEVDVLSSQPSYKTEMENQRHPRFETIDGIKVHRLSLPHEIGHPMIRIVNALRLCVLVLWKAITRRYDVIMISTLPPVLGGAAASFAARLTGARFIYHCMDIHPEVGRISGEFANPMVYKLLRKLDTWTCKQAAPVVVLSRDMANTLRQRPGGGRFMIVVLNNFSLPSEKIILDNLPFKLVRRRLTVLFAGNIGRFQGLNTVVEAMGEIKDRDDIEFIFMGEGTAKSSLQKKVNTLGARVRFIGHQPVDVAKAVMRRVDAGFVSLTPGIYRYAFPSKTMTYMEQGCPLIVAVEPESELATEVKSQKYGYCIPLEDSKALANLLVRLADDLSWHPMMAQKAKQVAQKLFSEAVILDKWSNMLNSSTIANRKY